jgi:hypothetical protein
MCYIHVTPVHIQSECSTLQRKNAAQITPAHERDTVEIRAAVFRTPILCMSAAPLDENKLHTRMRKPSQETDQPEVQYTRFTACGWICGYRHMGYLIIRMT